MGPVLLQEETGVSRENLRFLVESLSYTIIVIVPVDCPVR